MDNLKAWRPRNFPSRPRLLAGVVVAVGFGLMTWSTVAYYNLSRYQSWVNQEVDRLAQEWYLTGNEAYVDSIDQISITLEQRFEEAWPQQEMVFWLGLALLIVGAFALNAARGNQLPRPPP